MKVLSKIFTFHNVSINTDKQCSKLIREATLHSTMFLLIPGQQRRSTRRKEPLHSTMFLLIQPDRSENEWQWRTFTFHNVSINTDVWMCLHTSIWTLHSTMFLLILLVQADHIVLLFFTFHNVSINTNGMAIYADGHLIFTFHNVSINTDIPMMAMFMPKLLYIPQCFY